MSRERVVITGLGPISCVGTDKETFWNAMTEGKTNTRRIEFPSYKMDQYASHIAVPVDNFSLLNFVEDGKGFKRMGRATQFALAGTVQALRDAGFTLSKRIAGDKKEGSPYHIEGIPPHRIGVILGAGVHNMDISEKYHAILLRDRGGKRISPFALPYIPTNSISSAVAEQFNIKGVSFTLSTACASGTHALAVAYQMLQSGTVDVIISGGVDACITPYVFAGFDSMRAMSTRNEDCTRASRPFDKERDGFVLGEGAGILVLERLDHAMKRGVPLAAEMAGWGMTSDAYHITVPNPQGTSAITALRNALASASLTPEEVEYINPHGTSTPLNDPMESYIIKTVFGEYAYKIPISSTKSMLGHTIGASGGLEAITCCLSMERGVIPPTINLDHPDVNYRDPHFPELDKRCDLDYVPHKAREQGVAISVSQSFGFGGQNSVIVLKRFAS